MPHVPGLRSAYTKVGRLVHVGRMLDKIRLHAAGQLPADYHANLGIGFDGHTCGFLRVAYADVKARTLAGGTDEELLAWCHERGGARTDAECVMFNRFMAKVGWRDDRAAVLRQRVAACGLTDRPIETFFDLIEFDEGRDPVADQSWLKL